jgi:phosphatidylinositol-4,5-bisphosphate 3-kinase
VTDLFTKYFQKQNKGRAFENARVVFRKSSAGYTVAARRPGSTVVQTNGHFFHTDFGHFFHINFGHFLGNWKIKCDVKREDRFFHFSPACAQTIGEGDERRQFEKEANQALEILSAYQPSPAVVRDQGFVEYYQELLAYDKSAVRPLLPQERLPM